MLGTLMKYELKSVGRVMLPIYGAFIAVSILFGVSLFAGEGRGEDSSFITDVAMSITGIVYVLLAVAIFVLTVILIIQRFYKNLLGNEGYLCFTLPVNTNAHIANKVLSAVIWTVCGALIAAISGFILLTFFVTPGEMFTDLGRVLDEITMYISGGQMTIYAVEIFALAVFSFALTAVKIYAAIAAGQMWTNHRVLGAVIAYIAFGICESILGNIAGAVTGDNFNFVATVGEHFDVAVNGLGELNVVFLIAIAVQLVLIAAYWAVTYVMLDRKLNLQ